MGDLAGMDLVPEPTIVAAALRACRRINDYALSTRYRFLGFLSLIGFYAFFVYISRVEVVSRCKVFKSTRTPGGVKTEWVFLGLSVLRKNNKMEVLSLEK